MDDPNNTNSSPENTGADNRQAIFTPQPPEPTGSATSAVPTQSSVNLSHPYLSNHPTQTFNTDTGDIILNTGSPKPKQNKRPFIIGGIILAVFVAVCVGVLLLVQALSKPSRNDVVKSFETYKNAIEYGPDNSGNEESWYIAQLSEYFYDSTTIDDQVQRISELYSDFKAKLQKSGIKISTELQNLISSETELLEYAVLYLNLDTAIQPLISTYLGTEDNTDASTLASQIIPTQSTSNFLNSFRDALQQYVVSELNMQNFYNENYCLTDGIIDNECVSLLDEDAAYEELRQQNESVGLKLQRYATRLWTELESCTEAIWEGLNE